MREQAQELKDMGLKVGLVSMPEKFCVGVNWKTPPSIKNWPKYKKDGVCIFTGDIEIVDVDTKNWKEEGDFNFTFVEFLKCFSWFEKLVYYKTINNGLQFPYYCANAGGNKKLAIRHGEKEALIETRGVGGLAVCPPTDGYQWLEGTWEDVPTLTDDERNEFIEACTEWNQGLDEVEIDISEAHTYKENTGKPGDDWACKNDFITWIKGHGWSVDSSRDGVVYLRRPGKDSGASASWNYAGLGRLFVWTTSVDLPQEKLLKPFAVKAYLEHHGDFKACAMELRESGYGNDALALVEAVETCQNWGEVGLILQAEKQKLGNANFLEMSLGIQALGIKGVTEKKIESLKNQVVQADVVDWQDELTEDEDGKIKGKIYNVDLILNKDPAFQNLFFYNDFSQSIIIKHPKTNEILDFDDTYMARLRVRLGREYGAFRPEDIEAVVLTIAKNNHFHPLQDHIRGVEWDGRPRAETWLSTYCGAQDTEANRIIGKKWLLSAIARLFRPGCKVDNMLVLEGGQGAKKSTVLRVLSYDNFLDGSLDIRSKDGLMLLFGKWIVEFSELEGMNGRTAEQTKAFLSKQDDRIRRPYGRKEELFKRTCVFAGTTNKKHYLEDSSGNRRFWPVETGHAKISALEADRDQIWAEVYLLFKNGAKWWIEEEADEALILRGEQGKRMNHDEMSQPIEAYATAQVMENGKACLKISEVWKTVYGGSLSQLDRRKQIELATTLRKIGAEKGEFTLKGVKFKGWIYEGGAS